MQLGVLIQSRVALRAVFVTFHGDWLDPPVPLKFQSILFSPMKSVGQSPTDSTVLRNKEQAQRHCDETEGLHHDVTCSIRK